MSFQNKYTIDLNGEWQLSGRKQSPESVKCSCFEAAELNIPATVPGNLEDALWFAGYVEDPYFGMNAKMLRPYEFYEWIYERNFNYDGQFRNLELKLDGVDCIATIFINGVQIGSCENALIPHRFPLGNHLRKGNNSIAVYLASANLHFSHYPLLANTFSASPFNYESLRIRRPAHSWGWDIAPRTALGGIFRSVTIEELPKHRLEEGFLQTLKVSENQAALRYSYRLSTTALGDELRMTLNGKCGNSEFHAETSVWSAQGAISLMVDDPCLWWPRHYGSPALYTVTVKLWRGKDELLLSEDFTAGIRTVKLHIEPVWTDSATPDFQFVINGLPVRVFGTNHVPLDALHSREQGRLENFFAMVRELDCNIIRVWGGGIYELPAFYDYCDREGLLVWQDFMMGCAIYPNDDEFCNVIKNEAETVVRMLRQHPSLALWVGDNECDLVYQWGKMNNLDPNSNRLTREIIPQICLNNDPLRPYLASSPLVSSMAFSRRSEEHQPDWYASEQHLWGPRDYFKSDFYRTTHASFLSETGYHGSPNASSIRKFIPPESCWPVKEDPNWYYHASNPFYPDHPCYNFRIDIMWKQIKEFFGFTPSDLESFARASQICQAEGLKYLIELFRSTPKCSGMIWWNLIDCWPQFSDAIVDYYGSKKLAYYIIRRIQQPVLVMVSEPDSWMRKIIVANDSRQDVKGTYCVRDAEDSTVFAKGDFYIKAGTIVEAEEIQVISTERQLLLIEWSLNDGTHGCNHMVTGYPQFDYSSFSEKWLPAIAALDNSFDSEVVGK